MKYTQIPTIMRRRASIDERIAWHGALSAPGKSIPTRRRRLGPALGTVCTIAITAAFLLLASYEGVLP